MLKVVGSVILSWWKPYSFVKSAYSSGGNVIFQWRGTLSVGLTSARGARGFECDPAGANPSVGGHEHQRVPPVGESLRPRSGRQCGRPWRRSARWRMASSVHQKRTICGKQMCVVAERSIELVQTSPRTSVVSRLTEQHRNQCQGRRTRLEVANELKRAGGSSGAGAGPRSTRARPPASAPRCRAPRGAATG